MTDRERLQHEHRPNYMDGHTGDVYFDEVSHLEHHGHPSYPSGKLLRPNLDFMHQDFPRGLHSVTESAMDTQPQRDDDYFAPRQAFRQPVEMRSTFSLSVIKDIRPNPMDIFTPSGSSSPGLAVELDNDYTNQDVYQEKDSDMNLGYTRANMNESEEGSFEVIEDDNALSDQERENFLVPAASSGLLRDEDTGQDLAGRLSKSLGSLRAYEQMLMDESNIGQFMTTLNVPDYNTNQRQASTLNFSYTTTKSVAGLSEAMTLTSSYKQERSSDTSGETSDKVNYFTPSTFPRQQFDSVADQNWDQIDKALHMLADFRGLSSTDEDTSTLTDITSEQSSEYVDRSVKETDDNNAERKADTGDAVGHVENTEDDDDTFSRNTEETYLGPSEVSYFIGSLHDDSVTSDGEESYVDDAQIERLENVVQQYRHKVRDLEAQSEQRPASPLPDRQLRYSPLLPNRYYEVDDNSMENDLSLASAEPTYRDNCKHAVENQRSYDQESNPDRGASRQEFTEGYSHERETSPADYPGYYSFDDNRATTERSFEHGRDQLNNGTYDRNEDRDYDHESPREDSRQRNLFQNYVEEYQPTNDYVDQPTDNFQNRPPSDETYDRFEGSSYERNNMADVQNDSFVSNMEDNFHVADAEKETFVRDHAVSQATRNYEPDELTPSFIPQDTLEEVSTLRKTGYSPIDSRSQSSTESHIDSATENDKEEMQADSAADQSVNGQVGVDPTVWDYEELRFLSAPMLDYYDETALMDYGYSAERRHESSRSDGEDRMLTSAVTPPRDGSHENSERNSDIRNDLYSDSLEDTTNTFYAQNNGRVDDHISYNEDDDLSNEHVDNGGLDRTKRAVEDAYQLLQSANQEAGSRTDNSVRYNERTQDIGFEERNEHAHRFELGRTEADKRNDDGSVSGQNEEYSEKDSLDSENLQHFNETLQRVYENDQSSKDHQHESFKPFRDEGGINQSTQHGSQGQGYKDGDSFGFSRQAEFINRNDEEQFAQRQTDNFRDEDSVSGNWERRESDGYQKSERHKNQDYYEEPRRAESPYFEDIDAEKMTFRFDYDESRRHEKIDGQQDNENEDRSERPEVADDLSFNTRQSEGYGDVPTRDVPEKGYERAESPTYEEPVLRSEDASNVQIENREENRTANELQNDESEITADENETEVPHLDTEHGVQEEVSGSEETDNELLDETKRSQGEHPEDIRETTQAVDFEGNYADSRAKSPFRGNIDSDRNEFRDLPNLEANYVQANNEEAGNEQYEKFDLSHRRNYQFDKNNEAEFERNSDTPAMEYYGYNESQAYGNQPADFPTEQRQQTWSNNQSMSNNRFDDGRSNSRDFDNQQEYSENNRVYYSSENERDYNESASKNYEPNQREITESPFNEEIGNQDMTFRSSPPRQNFDALNEKSPSDDQDGRDSFNEEQYSNEGSRTERDEDASGEMNQDASRSGNTDEAPQEQVEGSALSDEASLGVSEVQHHVGCTLDESTRQENGVDEVSKDEIDTNVGYISALSSFMENPSGALNDVEAGQEQNEADSNKDESDDLHVQEKPEYSKKNYTNDMDDPNTVSQDGDNNTGQDMHHQVYENVERMKQSDDYRDGSERNMEDSFDYSNEPFYVERRDQLDNLDGHQFAERPQQYFDRTNEKYSQDYPYGQREEYSNNAPFDNYNDGTTNRFQESSRNYAQNERFSYQEPEEVMYGRYPERNDYDETQQDHQTNTRNDDRDLSYEQQNYREGFSPNLESGEQFQRDQMYQAEPRESNYGMTDSNTEQLNENNLSDEPEFITENVIPAYDEPNELSETSTTDRPEGTSTVESAEIFTRDHAFNKPEDQGVRQPSFIYIGSEPDSEAGDEADETPNEEDDDDEYFNRIEPYYVVEDAEYQLGDLVVPSIEPPESVLMDDRRTQWNLAEHVNLSDLQDHYIAKAGSTDILHSALDRLFTQQSLRDVTTGQYASSLAHATEMMDSELDSESVSPASKGNARRIEEDLAELSDGSASLTSGDTNSAQLRRRTLKPSGQRSWYQLDNLPVNTDKLGGGSNRPSQTAFPMDSITLSVHSAKIPSQSTGGYDTERTVATSITTSMAPPIIAALAAMIPAPPAQLSRSVESSGFEAPEIPAESSPSEVPAVTPRQATRSAPPIPSARASRHIITRPPVLPATKSAALASQAEIHQAGDHRTISQVWHFDRGIIEPYKNVLDIRPDEGTEPTAVLFYPCLLPDRSLDTYDRIMDHLHKFVMSRLEEIEDKPFRIFVFNAAVPTGTEHAVTWIQHVHKSMDPAMKENMQSLLIVHPNLKTKTELKTIGRAVLGKEFYNKIHFVKSLKDLSRMQSVQYAAIPKPVRDHDRRREWKLTKNTCGC